MTPKEKAIMLISETTQFQGNGGKIDLQDFKFDHDISKLMSQYVCCIAQWEHKKDSERFLYWKQVYAEIEQL